MVFRREEGRGVGLDTKGGHSGGKGRVPAFIGENTQPCCVIVQRNGKGLPSREGK